jgi:hypothetical protein
MKNPSPITITIISAILAASIQAGFAQPSPRYIDKNCRLNQELSETERFTLFNNSDFTANGQNYWFYAARYLDGTVLFCISKPNFSQPKPLTEKQIQSQFIDKIARDPNNKTAFIILVREGNGPPGPRDKLRLKFEQCRSPKTHLPFHPKAAGNPQRRRIPPTHISRPGRSSITIDLKSRAFDHSTLTYIYFRIHSTSLSTHPRSSAFIRIHLRLKNPNLKFSQQPKIPN